MNEDSIIEKGLDIAKDFLQKLINPTIEELGLLLADKIKYYRFINQIKILRRAERYVQDNKIQIKQIPIKILVPLLEQSSLEENSELQDKWIALLVNYIDDSKEIDSNIFVDILSQLSAKEARCIDDMYDKKTLDDSEFYLLWEQHKLTWINVYNLKRLGLLETTKDLSLADDYIDNNDIDSKHKIIELGDKEFKLTPLGIEFIKTCRINKNNYGSQHAV